MADFESIYREYGRVVYAYLLTLARDPVLAEELTQETMFRAIMNIGTFRGDCEMRVWLCQIGRNLYYDHQKKKRRSVALEEAALTPGSGDLAAALEDRDTAQRILELLHGLEEPYNEVFTLRALGDVPLKQISKLFGKSDSWARVTYYRAKTMIIERMKEGSQ